MLMLEFFFSNETRLLFYNETKTIIGYMPILEPILVFVIKLFFFEVKSFCLFEEKSSKRLCFYKHKHKRKHTFYMSVYIGFRKFWEENVLINLPWENYNLKIWTFKCNYYEFFFGFGSIWSHELNLDVE
jgi:hypothetical protein